MNNKSAYLYSKLRLAAKDHQYMKYKMKVKKRNKKNALTQYARDKMKNGNMRYNNCHMLTYETCESIHRSDTKILLTSQISVLSFLFIRNVGRQSEEVSLRDRGSFCD